MYEPPAILNAPGTKDILFVFELDSATLTPFSSKTIFIIGFGVWVERLTITFWFLVNELLLPGLVIFTTGTLAEVCTVSYS